MIEQATRKRMNIYITTSKNNLKYAYVSVKSLFINNQDAEIFLYVVSEDLTEADMRYERELADLYGHHIVILRFDEKMADEFINIPKDGHWPIGTMSSYWLFHKLLPPEVDKIMVIESDTVTIGSLLELYQVDFEGCYAICPGPEHKPVNHSNFMKKLGGECLTFVLSMYNVAKIREDFELTDILAADEKVKRAAGNSQMEFTFGLLFAGKIKYFPGIESCLDENIRYMEELGYDYIVNAEKKVRLLHFSSYDDYGKPWNPVQIMPGYYVWWQYAQGSPYYREYFEEQWKRYAKTLEEKEAVKRNISYRNILGMILFLVLLLSGTLLIIEREWRLLGGLAICIVLSVFVTFAVREFGKIIGK